MSNVVFYKNLYNLKKALKYFEIESFRNCTTPIKLHMGELFNNNINHNLIKLLVEILKERDVNPYLFDTTVRYPTLRFFKIGYKLIAYMNGFSIDKIGCKIKIDNSGYPININNQIIEVAKDIVKSNQFIVISHITGHNITGISGALKNLGMGCVTTKTKKKIHNGGRPIYNVDSCTLCGICVDSCPIDAIKLKNNKWKFDKLFCSGCGICIDSCPTNALTFEEANFHYNLILAAKASIQKKNIIYINDLNNITQYCDCASNPGKIFMPNIGYLVSDDPVAIDKASLDLIENIQENIFQKIHNVDATIQLKKAEKNKLGKLNYDLVKL